MPFINGYREPRVTLHGSQINLTFLSGNNIFANTFVKRIILKNLCLFENGWYISPSHWKVRLEYLKWYAYEVISGTEKIYIFIHLPFLQILVEPNRCHLGIALSLLFSLWRILSYEGWNSPNLMHLWNAKRRILNITATEWNSIERAVIMVGISSPNSWPVSLIMFDLLTKYDVSSRYSFESILSHQ